MAGLGHGLDWVKELHERGETQASEALAADPVCSGRVASGTVAALGRALAWGRMSPVRAFAYGQSCERADVLAFLRKRQRAAEVVGARSPEEAERAQIIVQQIAVMIEMIEQGLHECDAEAEAVLDTNSVEVAA